MEPNVFVKAEIPLDAPICQYMRLDYFISLLATGEYFVRPRCEFEDAFEANLPLPKMLPIHEAGKTVPQQVLDEEINKMSEKLEANRENGKLLTSCWCLQMCENLLMWNCYASKIGVRIKSTVHRFVSALDTDAYDILCGRMNYTVYNYYNDDFLFSKDKGYGGEDEFRFYFMPKNSDPESDSEKPKPVRIKVNLLELIEDVMLSPYIETRAANEICKFAKDKCGITMRPSSLKINR